MASQRRESYGNADKLNQTKIAMLRDFSEQNLCSKDPGLTVFTGSVPDTNIVKSVVPGLEPNRQGWEQGSTGAKVGA